MPSKDILTGEDRALKAGDTVVIRFDSGQINISFIINKEELPDDKRTNKVDIAWDIAETIAKHFGLDLDRMDSVLIPGLLLFSLGNPEDED